MDPATMKQLALVAVPPLVIGFFVALCAWWRVGRANVGQAKVGRANGQAEGPDGTLIFRKAYWAIPLAAGLTYAIFQPVALSRLPWPMTSSQDRPIVAAIVATILAVLALAVRFNVWGRWAGRLFATAGVGAFIAWSPLTNRWSTQEALLTLGGFVVATLVTWWALERVADSDLSKEPNESRRSGGFSAAMVGSAVAGAAANAMVITFSSLSLAQLAGILAMFMIGVAAAAVIRPRLSIGFGTAHVVALVTQSIVLVGMITTSTPFERAYPWLVALVAIAAVLVDEVFLKDGMARAGLPRRLPTWVHGLARVLAAAAIVGVTMGLALANMPSFEY